MTLVARKLDQNDCPLKSGLLFSSKPPSSKAWKVRDTLPFVGKIGDTLLLGNRGIHCVACTLSVLVWWKPRSDRREIGTSNFKLSRPLLTSTGLSWPRFSPLQLKFSTRIHHQILHWNWNCSKHPFSTGLSLVQGTYSEPNYSVQTITPQNDILWCFCC